METVIVSIAVAFVTLCLFLAGRNDWVRLQGLARSVDAEVIRHHSQMHDNSRSYAAVYAFDAEGKRHEVTDQVYGGLPFPPVGTRVKLTYPFGRPDLARPPRPLMWLVIYGVLLFLLGVLVAKLAGGL